VTGAAVVLAAAQLSELEAMSEGALEVLDRPAADGEGAGSFVISIDTGIDGAGPGIRVRSRERFRIVVSGTFPYQPPSVWVEHRRWADSRHVQWGSLLCLYAAPSVEWVPADGMRGLLDRLLRWLERAAEGMLDPDGQPLHPPVAYPTATGCAIVHPNLGNRVPWSTEVGDRVVCLYAWCVRDGDRIDVLNWLTEEQVIDRASSVTARSTNLQDRPYFVVLTVLIRDELGWEYPTKADQLAERLSQAGYSRDTLVNDLTWTNLVNQVLRSRTATTNRDTDPVVVLLGTPSRRVAGDRRLAHLVGWKLDQFSEDITTVLANRADRFTKRNDRWLTDLARRWLRTADVQWIQVYEQRTEVTERRDHGTALAWVRGRRVLVLGCGALGAPVAEYCVRAGATSVTVHDHRDVTPGILVRQPYRDRDIGHPKADALADRLNTITRKPTAHGLVGDAITFVLRDFDAPAFDLIVDATADSGVRAAIEQAHRPHQTPDVPWPPTVTMIIGHRADLGLVTVSRPGATGTGHNVLRRVALRAQRTRAPGWQDVIADFFPNPPRTEMFFPEPGCSAPTFVGSAADVTTLAALMLTEAVRALAAEEGDQQMMTATAIRHPRVAHGLRHAATESLTWPNDIVLTESSTGHDVRISTEAMAEIRTEVRRGARVRGSRIETGGMLLGAIDESTGVVSVDLATGPPPDSKLSDRYFDHGTLGTQDIIDHYAERTGGITGFLGIWHTHPDGPASPSPTDHNGMNAVTTSTGAARRALMVILGGTPATWNAWTEGDGLPEIYVRVMERDLTTAPGNAVRPAGQAQDAPPSGHYFPGGFSTPREDPPPQGRRWWLPWRKR
jgi:integrative and conjugative element protein (TIGR02256 family)